MIYLHPVGENESYDKEGESRVTKHIAVISVQIIVVFAYLAHHRISDSETRIERLTILSHEEVTGPESQDDILGVFTAIRRYSLWFIKVYLNLCFPLRKLDNFIGEIDFYG